MKSTPNVSNTPIPPMDFLSSTLGSEVGATLLSEEEEEEEEERYAVVSKNLFDYTPAHSTENLEDSGKASHQSRMDSSGLSDHSAQNTHSLNHQRAPVSSHKPTEKLGTLPRRRDANTDAAAKALHSVGSRLNSSWNSASPDPSEECMVTVSTLERQHMGPWGGTGASGRGTLGRGSHKRPSDQPMNGLPPNSTERREHCRVLMKYVGLKSLAALGHTACLWRGELLSHLLSLTDGDRSAQRHRETEL
ncbi:hypothetical protein WMY93_007391 [Mugilogobius chulae]|uniref:Uncharacterized protein n=1 Tax=Mugilogobius chulae TaxID=88201 RepID=A0AAW0PD19_9GOBI